MRRVITVFLLLLAIGSGAAASWITYRVLSDQKNGTLTTLVPETPVQSVVVAAVPLSYGTVLGPQHLKTISWPADTPQGSFGKEEPLLGRAMIMEVVPDEPILEGKLAPVDSAGGLSAVIPRGKRAVSVRVNEIIGVAGFVLPRTRVDVLVSVNPQGDKTRAASKVILQNVEVLAAGQTTERDAEGKPVTVNVITLLVDPGQAEKLTVASHEGDLQLALRNNLDLEDVETDGAVLGPMVQARQPEKQVQRSSNRRRTRRQPPAQTVEIIRGSERTVEKFH